MLNVNELLNAFSGTEHLYRHQLSGFVYTDGVAHLAEKYECYWLIDAVLSHQLDGRVSEEDFQVWKLKRLTNFQFILVCEDGNDNVITKQEIPFSDFTADEVTLYFVDETLLLPSEY